MSNKAEQNSTTSQSMEKMDAIKQLIFGENMVEYDQRFEEVMNRINKTQEELEEKLKSLDETINQTINKLELEFQNKSQKLEESLTKAIESLDEKKTDRRALGKMLQNVAEKLQS